MGCCNTLAGIMRSCDNSTGGIKRLWLGCRDKNSPPTVTTNVITAFPTGAQWYEYQFRKEVSNFECTTSIDDSGRANGWEIVLNVVFNKLTTAKSLEINNLIGSDLAAIVLDNNGTYWFLGYDYPLYIGESTAGTGTAFSDPNAYTLALDTWQKNLPYEVSATVAPTFDTTLSTTTSSTSTTS